MRKWRGVKDTAANHPLTQVKSREMWLFRGCSGQKVPRKTHFGLVVALHPFLGRARRLAVTHARGVVVVTGIVNVR